MPNHIVEQGECLSRIAAKYGFRHFRTIYDDPGNAELRKKRANPNLLFPGDVVFIPEKAKKRLPRPVDQEHRFQVAVSPRVLRIVVEQLDGQKMASTPYDLEIEGELIQGVTTADGLIECPIAPDAEQGSLTIAQYVWPLAVGHLNPLDEVEDDGISGVQARLKNMGYDPGPIDGIAGPLTEAAVAEFQADNPPLAVDGICGPQTRAKLIELYGC